MWPTFGIPQVFARRTVRSYITAVRSWLRSWMSPLPCGEDGYLRNLIAMAEHFDGLTRTMTSLSNDLTIRYHEVEKVDIASGASITEFRCFKSSGWYPSSTTAN